MRERRHTALVSRLVAVAACSAWAVRSRGAFGMLAQVRHACSAWVARGWAVHKIAEVVRRSELALAVSQGAPFPSVKTHHAVEVGIVGMLRGGGAQVRVLASSAEAPFPPAEGTPAERVPTAAAPGRRVLHGLPLSVTATRIVDPYLLPIGPGAARAPNSMAWGWSRGRASERCESVGFASGPLFLCLGTDTRDSGVGEDVYAEIWWELLSNRSPVLAVLPWQRLGA